MAKCQGRKDHCDVNTYPQFSVFEEKREKERETGKEDLKR